MQMMVMFVLKVKGEQPRRNSLAGHSGNTPKG